MTEKRFITEQSDYDLMYEFRVADTSRVEKTKEDFWNEDEECYDYFEYIDYLYSHNAFLTEEEVNKILNSLNDENNAQQKIIKNQEEKIKILQSEIESTYQILHMQCRKLKGWI